MIRENKEELRTVSKSILDLITRIGKYDAIFSAKVDLQYYIDIEKIEDIIIANDGGEVDAIREYVENIDGVFDIEIMYYSNAIDYLKENDPSLKYSLEIAKDYGFEDLENLNSELLASLLASQSARELFADEFEKIEDDIYELLSSYYESLED